MRNSDDPGCLAWFVAFRLHGTWMLASGFLWGLTTREARQYYPMMMLRKTNKPATIRPYTLLLTAWEISCRLPSTYWCLPDSALLTADIDLDAIRKTSDEGRLMMLRETKPRSTISLLRETRAPMEYASRDKTTDEMLCSTRATNLWPN